LSIAALVLSQNQLKCLLQLHSKEFLFFVTAAILNGGRAVGNHFEMGPATDSPSQICFDLVQWFQSETSVFIFTNCFVDHLLSFDYNILFVLLSFDYNILFVLL
jgi:hypothetical protein